MEHYDSSIHEKNRAGRWISKRTHTLVALDPATIPSEAAAAPGIPVEVELAGVMPPPVPQAPPQAPDFQAAAREGAFDRPEGSLGPQPSGGFSFSDLPGEPGEAQGLPHEQGQIVHAHTPGCYAGGSQGRLCACGAMVYDPMPDDEAKATATFALSMLNRMMPHSVPVTDEERDAWAVGLKMFSTKYGNPAGKYGPEIALAIAVLPSVMARRATSPEGAKVRPASRDTEQKPMQASSSRSPFAVFGE